jgi:1-acyl-sn-glycerol-3-phosphate acyltransferase
MEIGKMGDRHWGDILARRAIIIPLYYCVSLLVLTLLPALLLFTLIWDLLHRNSWALTRSLAFLLLYLGAETLSIFLAFAIWIGSGRVIGLGHERFLDWSYALQSWWGGWLFYGTFRIFGMRLEVDEPEGFDEGPLLVFLRHVSLPDTSLPGALFVLRHNLRIRHIIKKELLWDPVLNILGNRLRHYFVDRESRDSQKELEQIRALTADMGPRDGIMIFPEGTRFTLKKQAKILQDLAAKGDAFFHEKARALHHVLPPRLGGSLAILEANTKAYAVFGAHVGFEAVTKALNLVNGSLIHRTIRVKLWKVPFEKIPLTREERIEWLYANWRKIDEWIGQMKGGEPAPAANH